MEELSPEPPRRHPAVRLTAATAVALAFALGCYLLLEAARPDRGLVSFAFLLVLPAAISAFIAYVADPWAERTLRQYMKVPLWLIPAVIGTSIVFLREGAICVVILTPLWLLSSIVGAAVTYNVRQRIGHGRTYCAAALVLPLLAMAVEPGVPLATEEMTVTRSAVVYAPAEAIWPLLRGIPDVRPGEGRWNVTQDVLGVPRPLGAELVGDGIGAVRLARWSRHIRFREIVTQWQPARRIGWRFRFDGLRGWDVTDRHLLPDSPYFRVTTGGYTLVPLGRGRTLVSLDTRYRIRTPVNGYSALWGELLLGDMENNLIALVKDRAEAAQRTRVTKL